LRQAGEMEIVGLLTTVRADNGRVGVHDVPGALVRAQAEATGLPLTCVSLPWPCPNGEYEERMRGALVDARRESGVTYLAFGDLFLADVRAYRERLLAGTGVAPLFPLWSRPTDALAREMINGGLQARIVAVDPEVLPSDFVGRAFDHDLLDALPAGVDPCGENGEFHTFVNAGPMFVQSVPATLDTP
jgi:uncharacterized protein (TIGR00290 family)